MSPISDLPATLTQIYPPTPTFTEADVPADCLSCQAGTPVRPRVDQDSQRCRGQRSISSPVQRYVCSQRIFHGQYNADVTGSSNKAQGRSHYKDIAVKSPPTTTSTQLKFLHLDLNDLNIVRAAVTTFAQQESRLDVLWNNAGTGANAGKPGQRTAQDLELMIGFHCVSTLLFTQLLVPELCAAAATCPPGQTRVVWTSSRLAEAGSPPNNIDMGRD